MADVYSDDTLQEFLIHAQLVHLNVVSLFHHFFVKNAYDMETLWIVMELCDSDFEKYLTQTLSEFDYDDKEQQLHWLYQLLQALEFIHSKDVLHRDLKPANILLKRVTTAKGHDYWIPKLADFGMARQFRSQDSKTITVGGTDVYNAPELWHVKYQHGIDGVLVRWCSCSMVFLFDGVLIRWCSCSMVFLFDGVLVRWCSCSMVFLFDGVLVRCSCCLSSLVVFRLLLLSCFFSLFLSLCLLFNCRLASHS
jgi:serine/threonine protein kinase